jgi:LysR family glycine cleavage system transcriptional activator
VPDFLVASDLADGRLVLLSEARLPTQQDYYLCIKEARRREPALVSLANWFKAQVKQQPRPETSQELHDSLSYIVEKNQ